MWRRVVWWIGEETAGFDPLNEAVELKIVVFKNLMLEGGGMKIVEASWNVMAHAQKKNFVFLRNGRVHLNRRGRQFSRLLAAELCASAVVMLDTPCFEVVWRVLATHSIRQFLLHFPSRESPYAIIFQLDCTKVKEMALTVMDRERKCTRPVRKVSSHFDYLENWSRGLDVTRQPVRGDLTVHP